MIPGGKWDGEWGPRATYRPLRDHFLPLAQSGQHLQTLVPQLDANSHDQVSPYPGDEQGLQNETQMHSAKLGDFSPTEEVRTKLK